MKKIILMIISLVAISSTVNAEETWRELYVTRLMKLMNANPAYTDIVLTDIDRNGVPEAFLIKKGINGGIGNAITFKDSVLVNLDIPNNVTGECLEDITVYDAGGENIFVGKEVGRYTDKIEYFQLVLSENALECVPVNKKDFAMYPALPYEDIYDDDFYVDEYPNRAKLQAFVERYNPQIHINVRHSTAKISVNGNPVDMSGIYVNGNNYYKIRDIAMVLSTGVNRFSISWDDVNSAISITTGKKYVPVGGELSGEKDITNSVIEKNDAKIIVNGQAYIVDAYNIDGNNYFKIRDLSELVGFNVGWDNSTNTVTISNN